MSVRAFALFALLLMAGPARALPADVEFFEAKIRPALAEHCLSCHGEKKQKGALRLDTRAGWEAGGDNGPALRPGKAKDSLLIHMVKGRPGSPPQMPPDGVLPASVVADFEKWVDMGAPDPRDGKTTVAQAIDWTAARQFWAYQPVKPVEPPPATDPKWSQPIDRFVAAKRAAAGVAPAGPADRRTLIRRVTFGLTGLPPTDEEVRAFEADKSADAFAKVIDRLLASPHYGEHQARMWLDLARYGEDQSDSDGDLGKIEHAWRYRDWAIEAFNKDLPYNRFAKLQLAADLMEGESGDPADRRALGLIGLGAVYARPNDLDRKRAEEWDDRLDTITRSFLGLTVACARCHDHKYDPIPTQDYYSLAGVIAGTKSAVLSIAPRDQTAAYDAAKLRATEAGDAAKAFVQAEADRLATIKTDDFPRYALAAWEFAAKKLDDPAFKPDELAQRAGLTPAELVGFEKYLRKGPGRSKQLAEWEKLLPAKDGPREPNTQVRELAALFASQVKENLAKPIKKGRNLDVQNELFGEKGIFPLTEKTVPAGASSEWKAQHAELQAKAKAATDAMPPELPRCNGIVEAEKTEDLKVYVRGDPSKRGELAPRRFLRVLAGPDAAKFTRGSGRLELAESIADPANPLTARVMVNRIWQQHFGRGIVATPSNFGQLGARPTHPELLDYLADKFVRDGWSIKRLHREILLSQTYQLASTADAKNQERDPDNQWLWRMPRRRLTVEGFRDATLFACGTLDRAAGGPSGTIDDPAFIRRTVYGKVSRHDLSKLLRLFDFPAPNISSDLRTDTTLPQQALFLMNSPFMAARAKELAARAQKTGGPAEQVRAAYAFALARAPTEQELAVAVAFLTASDAAVTVPVIAAKGKPEAAPPTRLERFAQALLACNEFFYVD